MIYKFTNRAKKVIEIADYVTDDNNNEGVKKALEKINNKEI